MSKFYVIGKASPELLKKMHADPAADSKIPWAKVILAGIPIIILE